MVDNLSKRLLELEFKSNHSTKSKCFKWIVKKILPDYKKSVAKKNKETKPKYPKKEISYYLKGGKKTKNENV